jgi:hypothetical protein
MLAPAISVSKAKTLRLLTGTSFFQTDPKVLREWLKLSKSGKVEARLHHPKNFTFHPRSQLSARAICHRADCMEISSALFLSNRAPC